MYYGSGNFCSWNCLNDWFQEFGDKAIDHFGRTTEPKHLTEENAWYKTLDWNSNDDRVYAYVNGITKEVISLTREQYRDNNYTLNER